MDEYIINSIKKFKIKNDVNSDVFIHEYYTYTYNKVKYIDIYVYKRDKNIKCIKINDLMSIFTNFIDDNVSVLTYKYNDVKNNLFITSYLDDNDRKYLDNKILIDYNDYVFDSSSINLLKKLDLHGFPDILVVPKTTKNYYICACGTVNTGKECKNCSASKKFIEYYDTVVKINRAYAKKQFENYKFDCEDIDYELKYFKDQLIQDEEVDVDYLDDDFFDSLKEDAKLKVIESKNKSKIHNTILKCVLIFVGVLILYGIVSSINNSSKSRKSMEEFISNYCSETKYDSKSIDLIIKNYKCSDYIYYIKKQDNDRYDLMTIINSNNTELYRLYYDVKKENLHETYVNDNSRDEKVNLDRQDIFNNITYLDYLYNNNYEIDSLTIDTVLLKNIIEDNKDEFVKYLKYVPLTKDKEWHYDNSLFDYSIKYKDELKEIVSEYNIDYKEFDLVDYAYNYHEITKVNRCFDADFGDAKNIKKVMELGGDCSFSMLSYADNDIALENYYKAGGDMNVASEYSGNLFHYIISDTKYSDVSLFKEKISNLKKYGVNINYEKEDNWGGKTPLDLFISNYSNYSDCRDIKQGFSVSAYEAKSCEIGKEKYRILKQYGAVCKTECENEKYLK